MECEGSLARGFSTRDTPSKCVTPSQCGEGPLTGLRTSSAVTRAVVLRCEECECVSEDALGWIALVIDDEEEPDQDAYVVAYCPECTTREFPRISRRG